MGATFAGVRVILLLCGALLAAGGLVTSVFSQRAHTALDRTLTVEAGEHRAAVGDYFDRAEDIVLVSAQNPAFERFYATPGPRTTKVASHEIMGEIQSALAYLQVLYPGRVRAASFIDGTGAENARVVRGVVVPPAELAPDVSDSPFFHETRTLRPGRVLQTRPYVSPSTGEWVISNSTMVPLTSGTAMLEFEITVESVRVANEPGDSTYSLQIIDRSTGAVVTDSRHPQRSGQPLGRPSDSSFRSLRTVEPAADLVTVGGHRLAYERLEADGERAAVNRNDWIVVISAPAGAGPWSTPIGFGPLALLAAGLVLLVFAGLGFRAHRRRVLDQAHTDELTGLPNRLLFRERLAAVAEQTSGAVLLLDLDRFKVVNDTLGHQAGDQILIEVARRLREHLEHAGHLVARLGGDEFAVLVRDMVDEQEATALAAEIQQIIRGTTTVDGVGVTTSTSIGIALIPRHGQDAGLLLRCADIAMYHAKRTTTGYRLYAPEQDRHSAASLGFEVALLGAIEAEQLVLHYQPSVDPNTGEVLRVEALLRWHHPEAGLLAPAGFLALAEEMGMMSELTGYVLETALDQCAAWRADGLSIEVSVNLPAESCTDADLPATIETMLDVRGLPASALRLEITEHSALAPTAATVLTQLHSLGIGIALDDFGTGYSSLSYLNSLPIDEIKIDRSFVAAIERDGTDTVIPRATIEMAHSLGHTVTAEGVENPDSMRILTDLGVDAIQGYHVSHPLPSAELRQWLRLPRRGTTVRTGGERVARQAAVENRADTPAT